MRMSDISFTSFVKALDACGFAAWEESAGPEEPVDCFYCLFHLDEAQRNYLIRAFDVRDLAEKMKSDADVFPVGMLQLTCEFPFAVRPEANSELARLLHQLNMLLPLGTFLLSEAQENVTWRCILPYEDRRLGTDTVVSAVAVAKSTCSQHVPLIEAVAQGECSFDQVLSELNETDDSNAG
jgi:hypothetical protein